MVNIEKMIDRTIESNQSYMEGGQITKRCSICGTKTWGENNIKAWFGEDINRKDGWHEFCRFCRNTGKADYVGSLRDTPPFEVANNQPSKPTVSYNNCFKPFTHRAIKPLMIIDDKLKGEGIFDPKLLPPKARNKGYNALKEGKRVFISDVERIGEWGKHGFIDWEGFLGMYEDWDMTVVS